MAAPLGAAIAQSDPRTLTVRADNDAFDFWMYPWNRPDFEYTSGVPLPTPSGFMEGTYGMVTVDGRSFDIEIPLF